jgi:holliday junction DNA helicase RuvA
MIRLIRGTVVARGKDYLLIDVGGPTGGIGLKVSVPDPLAASATLQEPITLHTYLQVREDALNLYGFTSPEELQTFEQLLGVNSVGPKVALATLSVLNPESLRLAVANEEPGLIARVPGIGKRTAEKIVLELKDKLKLGTGLQALAQTVDADVEVIEALIALGYSVVEAQRAVQRIPKDVTTIEDRLRLALGQFTQP